jgi:pimeloyl-ACP methyl ester carboxylesterase
VEVQPVAVHDVEGLHVEVAGDLGSATPVVLVHGVGSDASRWDALTVALLELGPVIRYDLRGHGRSSKPPGPYLLEDFVADHLRTLNQLGVNRAHHVGMSLGGMIVQAVAARHADVVDRLVVLSAVAGRTPAQREAVLERLRRVEDGGPSAVADSGVRWYSDGYRERHADVVRRHLERFLSNDPAAYAASFRVLATNDLLDELPAITAASLVMTGSADVGSPPEMAHQMAARIPRCEVVIVEGVKHALLEEAAELVATTVRRFLDPSPEDRPASALPHVHTPTGPDSSATDEMHVPSKGEVSDSYSQ